MKLSDLQAADSYADLAPLFAIGVERFKANLYGGAGYKSFTISKKSGGVRLIDAPNSTRRRLQSALVSVLNEVYKPSSHVHGFVLDKSVASNALRHVGRQTIINLDLQEFFHSISFKRVRGVFLSPPFSLGWSVANILAQMCCHVGRLPAGGVTSPVLSNIIMARMDKRIAGFVRKQGGVYTRYADDLTLSFNRPTSQLSEIITRGSDGAVSIAGPLSEIITSEGFVINISKLHVASGSVRKLVTGVVINDKVNVQRRWLRTVESKVYAIEKFGVYHVAKSDMPEVEAEVASRAIFRSLHGKLCYLSMLRGRRDWVVSDLASRFNKLHSDRRLKVHDTEIVTERSRVWRAVYVIHASREARNNFVAEAPQGTGFVIECGFIVTAAHVISDESGALLPFVYLKNEGALKLIECDVVAHDPHRDLAIIKPKHHQAHLVRSRLELGFDSAVSEAVTTVGYPDYFHGHKTSAQTHYITKNFKASGVAKSTITGLVVGGLSGGPVINAKNMIVGVVHRGAGDHGPTNEMITASELRGWLVCLGIKP